MYLPTKNDSSMDGFERNRSRPLFTLGIVLCAIGLLGILMPKVTSIAISLIIAMMLIFTGIVLVSYCILFKKKDKWSWIKALTPLLFGFFLAIKPFALVMVIGFSVFFYFILDALASITIAYEIRPLPGWKLLFASGILSLVLAGAFILFWPYSTYWYVGIMVGASLILDGIFLISIS